MSGVCWSNRKTQLGWTIGKKFPGASTTCPDTSILMQTVCPLSWYAWRKMTTMSSISCVAEKTENIGCPVRNGPRMVSIIHLEPSTTALPSASAWMAFGQSNYSWLVTSFFAECVSLFAECIWTSLTKSIWAWFRARWRD